MPRSRQALLIGASAALLGILGCSGDDGGCVDIDTQCQPQYDPTFDNVFANSIAPNCAPPGTACHAVEGARGGLILSDPDQTYTLLTEDRGPVEAGDASCSILTDRINSTSQSFQMPPGNPLDPGEICAIERWIDNGAIR